MKSMDLPGFWPSRRHAAPNEAFYHISLSAGLDARL